MGANLVELPFIARRGLGDSRAELSSRQEGRVVCDLGKWKTLEDAQERGPPSNIFEALREIRNQVLHILDADRDADQRLRQANLLTQSARHSRVRHRGWMRYQCFGAA